MTTFDDLPLSPAHRALIEASAISPEVALARGYRSVTSKAELKRLGFSDRQARTPTLLIPVWSVAGTNGNYQVRADEPRISKGRVVKYELPAGSGMLLDVPPPARKWLGDPSRPLFITEGARKADAAVSVGLCCVALLGVWNWRGTNDAGGKLALPDWESIALNGRTVYPVFDSDVMTKREVHAALSRLGPFLRSRGAHVRYVYLPPGEGGVKVGFDDYLAAGNSVPDVLALASDELRRLPDEGDGAIGSIGPYAVHEGRICYKKREREGDVWLPLANFSATIKAEVERNDGTEVSRYFEIAGTLDNGRPLVPVLVPSGQYAGMNWVVASWGSDAVVGAGMGAKDRLREAIQRLSPEKTRRTVRTHTGWYLDGERWVFLSGDASIGTAGRIEGVEVELDGALAAYGLPDPPTGEALRGAVRASLRVLDVAPHGVSVPLLSAVYRASIGSADFSLHLAGPTGAGKSELAALGQQHYGPTLDARHLPANWSSTANSLEALAFLAKDVLLVIDDFAPGGSATDVQRLHRDADRVLRASGNNSGRQRMRADASLRPARPPRGLIVSTGEDVPAGHSLRARTLIIEVSPGDLDWRALSACQRDAAESRYAEALAGFVQWLAPRYQGIRDGLRAGLAELRQQAAGAGQHARTPGIVADLALGLRYFLQFAEEAGAIDPTAADALWARGWRALSEAAARQASHHAASEPARRFIELLQAALASGTAHLAGPDGDTPNAPGPAAFGWREATVGSGEHERREQRPLGARVGWVDGPDLYLEPAAALAAAQRLGRDTNEPLAITGKTLHKRLAERGLLVTTEAEWGRLTVRRTLSGARHYVLHLTTDVLVPTESNQSSQSDQTGDRAAASDSDSAGSGSIPWFDPGEAGAESNQRIEPFGGPPEPNPAPTGSVGSIGSSLGAYRSAHRRAARLHATPRCQVCAGPTAASRLVCINCQTEELERFRREAHAAGSD